MAHRVHFERFVILSISLLLALLVLSVPVAGAEDPEGTAASSPQLILGASISGFVRPVHIAHAGDGSGRLFVVEQGGLIKLVKNGVVQATPFLDISARVSCCGERGLLSVAFPPAYATTGHFYVNYTDLNGNTVIARYGLTANPDIADAASEQIVLQVTQPYANHNGGQIAFGPDGFLYVGMGDGGSGGDPGDRALNPAELLGKMLRIDVETGNPLTYTVPVTNPFVGNSAYRPEIWATGLRNPWRFSFDRLTGDLYIADVGQDAYEEINFHALSTAGGESYGWRIWEGLHPYATSAYTPTTVTWPVLEYAHGNPEVNCSVTGGMVYRGSRFPRLYGTYLYADFCSGHIWGLTKTATGWSNSLLLTVPLRISTFGDDQAGNLYVADLVSGKIYRLADQLYLQRVNAGGPAYTDHAGRLWEADRPFTHGSWGYAGGVVRSTTAAIADTADDPLYQTERAWGATNGIAYRFSVPNGRYQVTLRFAETIANQANKRKFSIRLEGATVLARYDIFAAAGGKNIAAPDQVFTVDVADGLLNIGFVALPGFGIPKVNAIEVRQLSFAWPASLPSPALLPEPD